MLSDLAEVFIYFIYLLLLLLLVNLFIYYIKSQHQTLNSLLSGNCMNGMLVMGFT